MSIIKILWENAITFWQQGIAVALFWKKSNKIKFGCVELRKELDQAFLKYSPECLKKRSRCISMHQVHWRSEGDSNMQLRWLCVHLKQFFWYFAWFTILLNGGKLPTSGSLPLIIRQDENPPGENCDEGWIGCRPRERQQGNPRIITNRPMQSWRVVSTQ